MVDLLSYFTSKTDSAWNIYPDDLLLVNSSGEPCFEGDCCHRTAVAQITSSASQDIFDIDWHRAIEGKDDDGNGVDIDNRGNVYVAKERDETNTSIIKYDSEGKELWTFDTGASCFQIAVDDVTGVSYTVGLRSGAKSVWKLDSAGSLLDSFDPGGVNFAALSVDINEITDHWVVGGTGSPDDVFKYDNNDSLDWTKNLSASAVSSVSDIKYAGSDVFCAGRINNPEWLLSLGTPLTQITSVSAGHIVDTNSNFLSPNDQVAPIVVGCIAYRWELISTLPDVFARAESSIVTNVTSTDLTLENDIGFTSIGERYSVTRSTGIHKLNHSTGAKVWSATRGTFNPVSLDVDDFGASYMADFTHEAVKFNSSGVLEWVLESRLGELQDFSAISLVNGLPDRFYVATDGNVNLGGGRIYKYTNTGSFNLISEHLVIGYYVGGSKLIREVRNSGEKIYFASRSG